MVRIEGTISNDGNIVLDLDDGVDEGEFMEGVEEGEDSNSEGWYGNDYPDEEDSDEEGGMGVGGFGGSDIGDSDSR